MRNKNNSKRRIVKISVIVALCMFVLSMRNTDVLAGGVIAYNHGVYCCDCGDSTRATERLQYDYMYENGRVRATTVTSITIPTERLDAYTHKLYVNGRCKTSYGKRVYVGSITRKNVEPSKKSYEHIWSSSTNAYDYFGDRVQAEFEIRKYGSVGKMTSLWHYCD